MLREVEERFLMRKVTAPSDDPLSPPFGLTILAAAAGEGKSVCSWTWFQQLKRQARAYYINESHGKPVDIAWVIKSILPGTQDLFWRDVVKRYDGEEMPPGYPEKPTEGQAILVDSATQWCWDAEEFQYSVSQLIIHERDKIMATGPNITRTNSNTKSGGMGGRLQSFLRAVDERCVSMKLAMVWTLSTTQFPIGVSKSDSPTEQRKKIYDLMKGIATGAAFPVRRGANGPGIILSTRDDRDEGMLQLDQSVMDVVAKQYLHQEPPRSQQISSPVTPSSQPTGSLIQSRMQEI
jgi:hypothetical protein